MRMFLWLIITAFALATFNVPLLLVMIVLGFIPYN